MKYWKCIDDKHGIDCTTSGKIYETDDLGIGLVDDKGFKFEHYEPWTFNAKFEEATYEDYIVQEFVEGRIAIQFENDDACEHWKKSLMKICSEYKVNNSWDFSLTLKDTEDSYYVDLSRNLVENDMEYIVKNITLSVPEENKKENEYMKKEFTKKDLVNGMVVETRNGNKYLVHNKKFINQYGWMSFNSYDDNLKETEVFEEEYDVMNVFLSETIFLNDIFNENNLTLIWKRDETEDLAEKEYKFELLTISPNGDSYLEDEDNEIFIKKKDMWDDDGDEYLAISLEEAKFMIESLTEIVNTIENN